MLLSVDPALNVDNPAPNNLSITVDETVDEGSVFHLAGSFDDNDDDTWDVIVQFGDGSSSSRLVPEGRTFAGSHVFAQSGTYNVTVTVTDADAAWVRTTFPVAVDNVVPMVEAGGDIAVDPGETVTRTVFITDPGAETWSVAIDWGDLLPPQQFDVAGRIFGISHAYAASGVFPVTVTVGDDGAITSHDDFNVTVHALETAVEGRHLFYNNSVFDGKDPNPGTADDAALAVDKTALLPDNTATFANYSSYSRGINGIMVDISNLPGVPTAADFRFKVGDDNDPDGWVDAPVPSITVRDDVGTNGSDRVTIIWQDNAIDRQWLQVTVLDTTPTGLDQPDVFYFGNAIGDSGNSAANARVNAIDMLMARNNPHPFADPVAVDFPHDFNRDRLVNAFDMLIARNNQTHFLNALGLIGVPAATSSAAATPAGAGLADDDSTLLDWLYEFDPQDDRGKRGQAPSRGDFRGV